jgi:glycosyltransferase involved in cell wall biosynthesis
MLDNPLVSIILTSYNQPELLEKAFDSLINQTYKNIEIIIVDDCSSNPLNKILINQYCTRYPNIVRCIIHPKNIGIAKNKNSGFRAAAGDYLTYLDGDDYYFPEKIETEIALFRQQPDLDVVYTNFVYATASGELIKDWAGYTMPQGYIFREIVKEQFPETILFRCELVKSKIFEQLDFYDENIKIYHDWDFRIRYAINSKIGYSPMVTNVYRRTQESITIKSSYSNMVNEKLLVIKKNRKLFESDLELKGFYKKFKKRITLDILFNTQVNFFNHIILCLKTALIYPFNLITVIKSIIHYLSPRKNKSILP